MHTDACVVSSAQRYNTSAASSPCPSGTQACVMHQQHGELPRWQAQAVSTQPASPVLEEPGVERSVRGAAQTAKPCMPHTPVSGVRDNNHHYPHFLTAPTAQMWAQPSRYALALSPSLLWPFFLAKDSPKVLSWLPACSLLQQVEREEEQLNGGCGEVSGHNVRSFLWWTQDGRADCVSFMLGSRPWCPVSGKDFGELKIQIFNLTFRLCCSEANLAPLKPQGRQ